MDNHEMELEQMLMDEYLDVPEGREPDFQGQYGLDMKSQDYNEQQLWEIDHAIEKFKEPTKPINPVEPRIKNVENEMEIIKVHNQLDKIVKYIDP